MPIRTSLTACGPEGDATGAIEQTLNDRELLYAQLVPALDVRKKPDLPIAKETAKPHRDLDDIVKRYRLNPTGTAATVCVAPPTRRRVQFSDQVMQVQVSSLQSSPDRGR